MRAAHGGPDAAAWRAFADRALNRLVRVHGTFADGTTPVVPGLRQRRDQSIADHYSSMSQYNGLSLYLIEHAAAHWPETVAGDPAAREGLTADLAVGGSGLVWGRAGKVWWAIQGWRAAGDDGRYSQGIVNVKVRARGGWRRLLASRPHRGAPRIDWTLRTRRGAARLALIRATGNGAHAVLTGHWHIAGRPVRRARWDARVRAGALHVATEPLRRDERVRAAVCASPRAKSLAHVRQRPCVCCDRLHRHRRRARMRRARFAPTGQAASTSPSATRAPSAQRSGVRGTVDRRNARCGARGARP